MSEVFWDGKGLPPMGCICEILPAYQKVKITYIGQNVGCYVDLLNGIEFSMSLSSVSFKPIKSEREKAIEDMTNMIRDVDKMASVGTVSRLIAEQLYDKGIRFVEADNAN